MKSSSCINMSGILKINGDLELAQSQANIIFFFSLQANPNQSNINVVADLYAEVIGVLATSRYETVKNYFSTCYKPSKLLNVLCSMI